MLYKTFYVYILTNFTNTTFYIGVTSDLNKRMYQHKNKLIEGFSKQYNLKKLVYFEQFKYFEDAVKYEKRLKNWHREWKINLIKEKNPDFVDLAEGWFEEGNGSKR